MSTKKLNIKEKLLAIQTELKAPKGQFNQFGKYKYRSCEDVLEALKPVLLKHRAVLTLDEEIFFLEGRFYVKAKAELADIDSDDAVRAYAYAREDESKKGMDPAQLTGACSSYARKYALSGLFLLDDTKDADTQDNREQPKKADADARKSKKEVSFEEDDIPDFSKDELENREIRGDTAAAGSKWKEFKTSDLKRLYEGPKLSKLEKTSQLDLRAVLEKRGALKKG